MEQGQMVGFFSLKGHQGRKMEVRRATIGNPLLTITKIKGTEFSF